jgi:N utilization substance protein B
MTSDNTRRRAREVVLQSLYALECGEVEADKSFSNILSETDLAPKSLEYAQFLYPLVRSEIAWADSHISRLAKNWRLERIATIDRCILRMAMVEIVKSPTVPVRAVLNEAIELAKTFSTPASASFVNGILDSFVKEVNQTTSE